MSFVKRNSDGSIVGIFANLQPGFAEEWIDDSTIPVEPRDFAAEIAKERYTREIAGVVAGGVCVLTDRDTQSKLTAAAVRAQRDAEYSIDWKKSDGTFVKLTAPQIISVADGVDNYVQACYSREAALLAGLRDGTFSEAMLGEGWP